MFQICNIMRRYRLADIIPDWCGKTQLMITKVQVALREITGREATPTLGWREAQYLLGDLESHLENRSWRRMGNLDDNGKIQFLTQVRLLMTPWVAIKRTPYTNIYAPTMRGRLEAIDEISENLHILSQHLN